MYKILFYTFLYSYARVSSRGQNLQSQIEALQKVGCERIFQEKKSGTQTTNRAERQADGIKSAQKRGVKFGRVAKLDNMMVEEALELQKEGWTNQQIAEEFDVGRSTLLRYIADYKKKNEIS